MARLRRVVGLNPIWNSDLYPFYLLVDVNCRKIKTNSFCEAFVKTFNNLY